MKVRAFNNSQQDWHIIHDICYNCGSKNVKKSFAYIRTAHLRYGKRFFCDIFDESTAFFVGYIGSKHIRIIDLAIISSEQRKWLGTQIMLYEISKARKQNIHKMTLRTAINEQGQKFWASLGGQFIGRSGDDWEMEIKF